MDIYLAKGFNSQHALSNMDEYAPFIDRTIYGIYSKGDQIHTTIHAGHPNGLTLKELVTLSSSLEESANSLAEQCGVEFDSSNIEIKLNIHSPGLIELIGAVSGAGVVLSLLVFSINNLINGGKVSLSYKKDKESGKINFSVESESVGLNGHTENEQRLELQKKTELLNLVNDLDIKSPEIISAILNNQEVTPTMIADAQKQLPSESQNSVE